MTDEANFLQDILKSRTTGTFVGRTEPLHQFEQNLSLPPKDPRRRFVVSLYGDAGVGKTSLVQRWVAAAEAKKYATAYVDEAYDVLSAIEELAAGLDRSGSPCRGFDSRLKQYRRQRRAVDSDPSAPSGISSLLTRAAVRIGLGAAGEVPVLGSVVGVIDKNEAAQQVDQVRAYLTGKFSKRDDRELLLSPVKILTEAFVADLQRIGKRRPIALFIDTFEQTGRFLNAWLLDLLAGKYGGLPMDIVVTLSGQHPLDPNQWVGFLNLRTDIELQVFTPDEARELLAEQGVVDPATVNVILRLSGCLPVLVALLAESTARGTTGRADPTETAVDRFLREETGKDRRDAIQAGAIPRRLDREILAVAAGTTVDLDSLRRLPFVSAHSDGYRYHDVVRTPMLRSLRRSDPGEWTSRHRALVDHYRHRLDQLGIPAGRRWRNGQWRELQLEATYHELCATGVAALPKALEGLIDSYGRTSDSAAKWARMIAQAGHDSDTDEVRSRGEQLSSLLAGEPSDELLLLEGLAADPSLDTFHRVSALAERSRLHERLKDYEGALHDLDRANALRPRTSWILSPRGSIHADLGHYDQAIADLDAAIELAPDYASPYQTRSRIHRRLNDYDAALRDIDRVLELSPGNAYYFTVRSSIHRDLRRYADAKADLDHALALAPSDTWVLLSRARLFQDQGRHHDALKELDRALEIDPEYAYALTDRADVLCQLRRYPEAFADLDRVLRAEPTYPWAYKLRARVYQESGNVARGVADFSEMIRADPDNLVLQTARADLHRRAGRYDEALRDLDHVLEVSPADLSALTGRARVYDELGKYRAAIADLDRALELDPASVSDLVMRARLESYLGRYDAAITDMDRALELRPDSPWVFRRRGSVHLDHGELELARTDLDRALEIDPGYAPALQARAQLHDLEGRHRQALEDLDGAIRNNPAGSNALRLRGTVKERLGDLAGARADHDRGVEVATAPGWPLIRRGEHFRRTGDYSAALHDFTRAIDLMPRTAACWTGRGETYQKMGNNPAALADFERAAELRRSDGWRMYRQALILMGSGEVEQARTLLSSAMATVDKEAALRHPDPRRLVHGAAFVAALGDQDKAIDWLKSFLAGNPPVRLRQQIGEELTELGEHIGAEKVAEVLAVVRSGEFDADVGGLGVEGE